MAIVQTIDNAYQFQQAFKAADRAEQFSYKGLRELFDYLEEYSDSTGEDYNLDVIGLCCDYRECESIEEFMQEYGEHSDIDIEEFSSASEDEQLEMIREYLEDNTSVVCCDDDCIMFACF